MENAAVQVLVDNVPEHEDVMHAAGPSLEVAVAVPRPVPSVPMLVC